MKAEQRVERVRDLFDDWAAVGRAQGMEAVHGHAARRAFEDLDVAPGHHFLDVGCGSGYTVRWAAEVVGPDGRSVGIDVSERMIAHALARAEPGQEFHQATFPHHGFEPESFDRIFSMEVLYYLPSVTEGLEAIRDLLVPSGRFACVLDYYVENEASHSWPQDLGCELTLLSEAGWREAFEQAGLKVASQERIRVPEGDAAGSLFTLGQRR